MVSGTGCTQARNETAAAKVIGLTLETRPDTIDEHGHEIRRLRAYGCTRVQLGVQHTDDAILRKINRGCTTADTVAAVRRLKDAGYKIDIHLMPNLPGASAEQDRAGRMLFYCIITRTSHSEAPIVKLP